MMIKQKISIGLLASGFITAGVLLSGGCRLESANTAIRDVPINVAGIYTNNGARIMSAHSGAAITRFNIIQDGSRLQAVDNHMNIWNGDIGRVTVEEGADALATFNLRGITTDGVEGMMTGTFSVSGTSAVMRGTYAEPELIGNVLAFASNVIQPPSPEPENGEENGEENDDDDDDAGSQIDISIPQ